MQSPTTFDRSLSRYDEKLNGDGVELDSRLKDVTDLRVLHVNSTASGGGVAELLQSLVPLFNDVGLETEWQVMDADESFFEVTKDLHNGLQGQDVGLTDEMKSTYRTVTERNATMVSDEFDVIVLHDPQSLGMIMTLADRFPDARFVWRCHIDLTSASQAHLSFVLSYVQKVDHVVLSHPEYSRGMSETPTTVIPPSIDPFAPKNRPLNPAEEAAERDQLTEISFDGDTPVVTQVSRFDPWKDQPGVIEAYRQVKEDVPGLQLVLVGEMADDDPEGVDVYEHVEDQVGDDSDIHLLTNQPATTINFLQRHSDVVLQKSLREGFGLVVSEALWKRTPVIGSDVGGIPLQITDGQNGHLVDPTDVVTVAKRIRRLLTDDELRQELGDRGRETVREQFLHPRHLSDYLGLFSEIRSDVQIP